MNRIRHLLIAAAGLFALLGPAGPETSGEIIRLKNGQELHCKILSCSEEEGITVERLDTGGVLDLGWDHMRAEDAQKIKLSYGFTGENAEPVRIRAKRVWLRNGTFEDGLLITSDKPGTVCLERKGKRYYFSQAQVRDVENIQADAQEICTPEDLFLQETGGRIPEEARECFNLGVYCESITYYPKALELYRKAGELDPSFKPDVIQRKIRLMETKLNEADATAVLDDVRSLIYRQKFALALDRIEEFERLYPQSVQSEDKIRLRGLALERRHAYFQQRILTDYFTYAERLANQIALDREISLQGALEFAAEEMGPAVRGKLAEDVFKIPLEEVEELWTNRKGGSVRSASYGTGTFVLGAKAKAMPEESKAEEKPAAEEKAEEGSSLDDRLKKRIEAIRKQKTAERSKPSSARGMEDIGLTPDQWWAAAAAQDRKRFLVAYYAEESGDLALVRIQLQPCRNCNGRGFLEQMSATAGEEDEKIPCEICKTLGVERTVFFR